MTNPKELLEQWVKNGKFTHKGLTYRRGINEISGQQLIQELMKGQTMIVPLSGYQDYTGNRDLDSNYHVGFKLVNNGKPGRQIYWLMTWHGSGHCTIYASTGDTPGRWVNGDSMIQIIWK